MKQVKEPVSIKISRTARLYTPVNTIWSIRIGLAVVVGSNA